MTSFESQWDSWTPKTPVRRTDITDKSPSVSNVSPSDRDIPAKTGLTTPLGQVAASKLPPANLDADDWRDFFDEHAAILEHDGGLSREQAERLAYESCVVGVMNATPSNYRQNSCSACGTHLKPQQGLPLADRAIVCDGKCHDDHRRQQRERAEQQLAEWGIRFDD